ncbi:MAG: hypothetical protein ACLS9K_08660 [Lachnospira eligens]
MGAEHFNIEQFGAKYAYTIDGDTEGEIQYENFNACKRIFILKASMYTQVLPKTP